jgi:hypothetical protein
MERVDPATELGKILVWGSQQKATDLHTQADRRYSLPRRPPQARPGAMNPPVDPDQTNFMYTLKLICLTIVNLVKQAWSLPETVTLALEQRRAKLARLQSETERLDRIRNPSKYAGR